MSATQTPTEYVTTAEASRILGVFAQGVPRIALIEGIRFRNLHPIKFSREDCERVARKANPANDPS